ncbi:MAG: TonB-dependent receptor, partial [Ectothiorhodospiraceae bacterium]|jgi:vitamin B12 transporter
VEINAQFLRAEGHNEFDGTPNTGDTAQQTVSAKLGWTPSIDFDTSLRVGQSLDDSKNFQNGSDYSRFTSRRDSASWQANYAFNPANLTTVGVDYYRDRVDATVDYTETSRRNTGVFLQHQIFIGDANVQAGLRHDDNEAYGENTTGSLALGYRVMPELRAYASYGTAFKAPSFNDLYWPDEPFFHGNPDLKPEESRTGEIGLAGEGAVHWKLSAYRTVVDDLIVYDPAAAEMVNVNQAVIDGVEGEVGADLGWADATVGATWLDPRDDDSGNVLPRRARRSAFLRLNHEMGDAEVGAQARYAGDRYDDPANNTKLDAYTVVDLTTAVHINPEWIVRGRIGNVFDEDYQTAATYNTRGRNVFVSLTWQQGGTR